MELLTVQFLLPSCQFIPLRSRYSPTHPVSNTLNLRSCNVIPLDGNGTMSHSSKELGVIRDMNNITVKKHSISGAKLLQFCGLIMIQRPSPTREILVRINTLSYLCIIIQFVRSADRSTKLKYSCSIFRRS
jgi:hypothetical protein